VLGILFALFLAVLAFDVFGEGLGPGKTAIALLIHLVPAVLALAALTVAWRREAIGAIFFTGAALAMPLASRGEAWVISVPLLLVGLLFWASWKAGPEPAAR
jgi:hypothetical protein